MTDKKEKKEYSTDCVEDGLRAMAKRLGISVEEAAKLAKDQVIERGKDETPGARESSADTLFTIDQTLKKIKGEKP